MRFVTTTEPGYADDSAADERMLRMVRARKGRLPAVDVGSRIPVPGPGSPTLERLVNQAQKLPGRRLRPGEGYDMHSNNGLSRKGRTG